MPRWIVARWAVGLFGRPRETDESIELERRYREAVRLVREVSREIRTGTTPTPAPRISDRVSVADLLAREALGR